MFAGGLRGSNVTRSTVGGWRSTTICGSVFASWSKTTSSARIGAELVTSRNGTSGARGSHVAREIVKRIREDASGGRGVIRARDLLLAPVKSSAHRGHGAERAERDQRAGRFGDAARRALAAAQRAAGRNLAAQHAVDPVHVRADARDVGGGGDVGGRLFDGRAAAAAPRYVHAAFVEQRGVERVLSGGVGVGPVDGGVDADE